MESNIFKRFIYLFIRYFLYLHFKCYPKSHPLPPTPTPTPLPTPPHFLALVFPCTGAYKVCKTKGPLFPIKTIQWKKDSILNKWCWHKWRLSSRRMRIDPFLSPGTKLKSKWIKKLHIKTETLKLIEEKVGETPQRYGHRGKFLNRTAILVV